MLGEAVWKQIRLRYKSAALGIVGVTMLPWNVAAQAESFCPKPYFTLDSLKAELQRRSPARNSNLDGMVRRALAPSPAPGCPVLLENADLQVALEDLVKFAAEIDDDWLRAEVFEGVTLALLTQRRRTAQPAIVTGTLLPQRRWIFVPTRIDLPLATVTSVIEQSSNEAARHGALRLLLRLLPNQDVARYLLSWARAPSGPSSYPSLARDIVLQVYSLAGEDNAALRDQLESDLAAIADPLIRCWVRNGGRPQDHMRPPHLPPTCG